jgi:uncharacterized protein (UPF0303 family)
MTTTDTAQLDADLAVMAEQERLLQLPALNGDVAWDLGQRLRVAALACGAAVTIEVRIAGETAFFHAMAGTAPANADWARRKRNVVELQGESSYRVGRQLLRDGRTLEGMMGLPTRDYGAHGGCFPLRVGGQLLGSVTVSGLPQREDHEMLVAVLAEMVGVPASAVAWRS